MSSVTALLNVCKAANSSDSTEAQKQFQTLPDALSNKIYGLIYSLAGSPQNVEWGWGQTHAFESLSRLKQAVEILLLSLDDSPTAAVAKKVSEIPQIQALAKPIILVDTTKTIRTRDYRDEFEHYSVSIITKENDTIEIAQWPVQESKYGNVEQLVIYDGKNPTVLTTEDPMIRRLMDYFTTDFDVLRKKMNAKHVGFNEYYPNKNVDFDCQRFSYYLQSGLEGNFSASWGAKPVANYRQRNHEHGWAYSLQAQTANFGKGGIYSREEYRLHHYVCLTDDVFVSKFGKLDVMFTSHQQILDAYFPKEYALGNSFLQLAT